MPVEVDLGVALEVLVEHRLVKVLRRSPTFVVFANLGIC